MHADPLSTTFAALADPTRRAILARLAEGSATVKELSEPFSMSGPAISKHLRVLERAGLISQGREAQWRPCRLEAAPLKAVADWTETYRRFWEESFDRLGDYLEVLKSRAEIEGRPSGGETQPVAEAKSVARKRIRRETVSPRSKRPAKKRGGR